MIEFISFIIKFPYDARSDWLKLRALSESERESMTVSWLSHFCLGILTNLTQISLLAEALFLVFADGRKETSAMGRKWLY